MQRLLLVWAGLISATLVSFTAIETGLGPLATIVVVISIAFLKIRYVGLEFMDLREAPAFLRLAFEFWLVGMALILISLYAF